VVSLLAGPVVAQFGVAGNKKRGTGFEDMNAAAKDDMAGFDMGALGDMAKMDPSKMQDYLSEAMNNPDIMDMLGGMGDGMEQAMADLAKMSPEEMAAQMKEAMDMISGEGYLDQALSNPEELLKTLGDSGMVDAAQMEEFKKDPEKLKNEMKDAVDQLKNMFGDPEALKSASEVAAQMSDFMQNPEKMQDMMKGYADQIENDLSNDDKIEEARLQLLSDPALAGSAEMTALFQGEEMQAILQDPLKWREAVQEGKGMLIDGVAGNK